MNCCIVDLEKYRSPRSCECAGQSATRNDRYRRGFTRYVGGLTEDECEGGEEREEECGGCGGIDLDLLLKRLAKFIIQ